MRPPATAFAALMVPEDVRELTVIAPTCDAVAVTDTAVKAPLTDAEAEFRAPVTEMELASRAPATEAVFNGSLPMTTVLAEGPTRTTPALAPVPASRTRSPPVLDD